LFDRDHPRDVVADGRDQRRPGRFELQPPLVADAAGHERAAALLTLDEALPLQQLDGLANGDASDLELAFQLVEGGDLLARLPLPILDPAPQSGCDLQIERYATALIGARQLGHVLWSYRSNLRMPH